MPTLQSAVVIAVACLISSAAVHAAPRDLKACLASNVPEKSVALTVRLESSDRAGRDYVHEARVLWKRSPDGLSKTLVCMTAPRDARGLTYLVHESESGFTLWVYLPEEGKVVRINPGAAASRGHIARTAISYEDIRYLPVNLSEAELEQGPDLVRFSLPPGTHSQYERVTSYIDPERCVPLKVNFNESGDRLRKLATADPDTIHREGKIWLARSIKIEDFKREVKTELVVKKVEIDPELADQIFDPHSQRGRCPN